MTDASTSCAEDFPAGRVDAFEENGLRRPGKAGSRRDNAGRETEMSKESAKDDDGEEDEEGWQERSEAINLVSKREEQQICVFRSREEALKAAMDAQQKTQGSSHSTI